MDVRQLKYFVTVAETLHFGKAAERLNMTQPPLSQSIMSLEKELGHTLFFRNKRNVQLTPFGEQWLFYVRNSLSSLNALPDIADRLGKGESGTLSLAFISVAGYNILPRLVSHFRQIYPAVELILKEATSDVQLSELLEERIDAGIIIPPEEAQLPGCLDYKKILSESLVAAVPQAWLDNGRLELTHGKLCSRSVINSPLIIFPQKAAPSFYKLVMQYYANNGTKPNIIQQAIQMQTIISLVASGIGLSLVPNSLRHLARTGVAYVELLENLPRLDIGFAWRKNNQSPLLKKLISLADTQVTTG
ncbi:transcriptional regulator, LysR family [Serratia sp. AS12]|uniref:LysR family transcriptional regulator n=1 Tax=Serratia sp. PAMC26656 TaxID=2775909 RepID=UPI00020E9BB1|nr:LysR family transcriptional regulator [Serratia sp. PAMC26656]AEF47397.1 transcriptional regulator, LysR family [Serratia plymuthica AS9]AEF52349.1 transcriptional regulator, LysR family [Serratia sp. AS12]AEG30056.1 transcriptional regulator, LysR family [Serratia sp. AS13]MBJ7894022.1 LysR family transcriptional regulator [Serratia sp. PAMC26656]